MEKIMALDKNPHMIDKHLQAQLDKCALQEQQIEELYAKLKWYEEQFRLGHNGTLVHIVRKPTLTN
jgi:hypothetical protein